MDWPMRRTAAVIAGTALLLAALVFWLGPNGTQDVARAAPADPYGTMTIDDFSGQQKLTTDIRDHSWELLSAPPAAGGGTGGGTGKADFNPFVITRSITPSSPAIALALAENRHFPRATIKIFKPGTSQVAAIFVLTEIELARLTESPGASATEVIEIVYDDIKWTQNDNEFCFDVILYAECLS